MKKLLLTAIVGLSLLNMADAATVTVIHITGSTAYRANTHNAIMHILGGTPATGTANTLPAGSGYAYTGSSLGGAGQAIFHGFYSGNEVLVETSWSGSAAGIQTVAGSLPVNFLDDSTSTTTTGNGGLSAGVNSQTPDVTMADCYQASTERCEQPGSGGGAQSGLGNTHHGVCGIGHRRAGGGVPVFADHQRHGHYRHAILAGRHSQRHHLSDW